MEIKVPVKRPPSVGVQVLASMGDIDTLAWLLAELQWEHQELLQRHEMHWHWQGDGVEVAEGATGTAEHGYR